MESASKAQRCGGRAFLLLVACSVPCLIRPGEAIGAKFAGGTGDPSDPYQIATAPQLTSIGGDPNLLGRHFVLVADIDLDPNLPGGTVFQTAVIAPDAALWAPQILGTPFSGTFDGRGHTLRHVTLSVVGQGSPCSAALFGAVGPTGVVRDLILEQVNVASQAATAVGGLVGANAGQIERCSVSGMISAVTPSVGACVAGGLVGINPGTILQCCCDVQVTGSQAACGGLVGGNTGTLLDCYATGRVDSGPARQPTGGLAGINLGQIVRCYAAGPAVPMDTFSVGALVGFGLQEQWAGASYFLREADGGGPDNGIGAALSSAQMAEQGSFWGWDFYGRPGDGVEDTWFMPDTGRPVLSWQTQKTGLRAVPEVRGLSEARATEALTQAGLSIATAGHDYDPYVTAGGALGTDSPAIVSPGSTVSLRISLGTYNWTQNPGDGTPANPYLLSSGGQLACLHLRPDLWHSSFALVNDLDMRCHVSEGAVIAPDLDQNDGPVEFQGTGFGGRVDGRDHAIKHLCIAAGAWSSYVGLFGQIEPNAVICRLRLEEACVRAGQYSFYTGILAGRCLGTVTDCSVQGTLIDGGLSRLIGPLAGLNEGTVTRCKIDSQLLASGNFIGGCVGVNTGQIRQCAVRGTSLIGSSGPVGGLAGTSSGGINDSYSVLEITMTERCTAGGLVGGLHGPGTQGYDFGVNEHQIGIEWDYGDGGFVRNCYAAGRMTAKTGPPSPAIQSGGLVGGSSTWNVPVTGGVWDVEATTMSISAAGTGLKTQQMVDLPTLAGFGFDFVNTWSICGGKEYPTLKWENVQCKETP